MAIFDKGKVKESIDVGRENVANFIDPARSNKNLMRGKKNTLTVEEIKNARNSCKNDMYLFIEKHETLTPKKSFDFYKNSILKESNAFFNQNIKTSKLEEIVKKVNAKVLDEFSFYKFDKEKNEEEPVEIFSTETSSFTVDKSELSKLSQNLIMFGDCYCKVNIVNGHFKFEFIESFRVFENDIYTDIVFRKSNKILIERRFNDSICFLFENETTGKLEIDWTHDHNLSNKLIFKLDIGDSVITPGSLEIILMQSKLFTTINHEIETTKTNIFMDQTYLKFYNSIREHFVPVASPDFIDEENQRPLFEVLQSNLKSEELKKANDILDNQLATNLMLDKATLGISTTTATEINISHSQTSDTINDLKMKIENVVTLFICDFLKNNEYKFKIKRYSMKNEKEIIQTTSQLLQVGGITELSAVKKINPEWTLVEQKQEAYTLMYQKGIPFTEKQREEAVELGILATEKSEGGVIDGAVLQ